MTRSSALGLILLVGFLFASTPIADGQPRLGAASRLPVELARLIDSQVDDSATNTFMYDFRVGLRQVPTDAAALAQAAIDSATLDLLKCIFDIPSSILAVVSGGLGTISASIAVGLEQWERTSGRIGYLTDVEEFGETLLSDGRDQILDSNLLGDAGKYVGLVYNIQQEIASGSLAGDIASQIQQLTTARAMLAAVTNSVIASKK